MKKFYVVLLALVCVVATTFGASRIKARYLSGSTATFIVAGNSTRVASIDIVNGSTSTIVCTVFYTSATSIATLGTAYTKFRLGDVVVTGSGTGSWTGDDFKYYNLGVVLSTGCNNVTGNFPITDVSLNAKIEE